MMRINFQFILVDLEDNATAGKSETNTAKKDAANAAGLIFRDEIG